MSVVIASVAWWAPVEFALPGDDGQAEVLEFRARFKRLKRSERVALDARVQASRIHFEAVQRGEPVPDGLVEPTSDAEILRTVLVDWDLQDKRAEPVPYTPQMLEQLAEDWDGFEAALVVAYFAERRRQMDPDARAKKSAPPSDTH